MTGIHHAVLSQKVEIRKGIRKRMDWATLASEANQQYSVVLTSGLIRELYQSGRIASNALESSIDHIPAVHTESKLWFDPQHRQFCLKAIDDVLTKGKYSRFYSLCGVGIA